jgi:PTH1 family peptidyl-tRNA hydrolase
VWVVVGLGNPGREYADTRHNLGFRVVDELLRRAGTRARRGAGDYELASARLAGITVLLVKPTAYVNRSGRALDQLGGRYSFSRAEVLAIVDDVSLPFGKLRLRPSGSAGGHNGLRSLVESLGDGGFPRLRLGVGAAPPGADLADYVLAPFATDEQRALPEFVARAADAVERVLTAGVECAMTVVNSAGSD